jgi:hypothetical protein
VIARLVALAVALFAVLAPAASAQETCPGGPGFESVGASPVSASDVRLTFERRVSEPVRVDVLAVSRGSRVVDERLVRRFDGQSSSVLWDGLDARGRAVPSGYYVARFTIVRSGRPLERRRVALARSGGRWSVRPAFERAPACDLVPIYRLESPVFGGSSGAPLRLTFRLERDARVRFTVRRVGGGVVSRQDPVPRTGRTTYLITLPASELRRGDYRVTLEAVAGQERVATSLTAHRL